MTSYTLRTLSLCMAWMPVTALAQTSTTFQLSLVPAQRTIVQGGWQNIAVEIARIRGFASPISLRIVGTPAGVTASFGQNPVTTRSTRLTLKVAATVAPGTYNLSVIGDAGTSVSAPFQLTVAGPLPPPSVSVDSTLRPALTSLAGPDANPRTIASLADAKTQTDFVLNELLLSTNDSARLSAFLTKWHGTVVTTVGTSATAVPNVPSLKLVRIDPSAANIAALPAHMLQANPNVTGALRFSSAEGMRLFAVAAEEAANGLTVGLNFVAQPASDFLNGVSTEAATGPPELNGSPYSSNVFGWSYMKRVSPSGFGVTHAWQALDYAGKLGNLTTVAIIEDGGFGPNGDFPTFNTISMIPGQMGSFVRNPTPNSGGKPAPWHGTMVAQSLAGRADNSFGAAGTAGAGPNAHLLLISQTSDIAGAVSAVVEAAALNARIVNMSFGGTIPWIADLGISQTMSDVMAGVQLTGVLIFASAGNKGEDVDDESCFLGICWENTFWWPCENDGVTCVGGLAHDSRDRAPASNYSSGFVGDVQTVDIWAPFDVMVGPDPDNPSNAARWVGGTSFSSPYVAGVAALVWAANPALSADQVEDILFTTAGISYDQTVNSDRVVLADLAVMAALGDMPPKVSITSPANNAQVPYGALNWVTFQGSAVDFEDGPKCCKFTWTSSKDGLLGTGATVKFVFQTPGSRQITLEADDLNGNKVFASIFVTAINSPPTVKINIPVAGTVLLQNVVKVFDGQGSDSNEPGFTLPCANLTWSTNVAGDPQLTGCNPAFQFATLGPRTISLVGKDSQGQISAPATIDINVVPAGTGPYVTITSPVNGSVYGKGEHSPLSFVITGGGIFHSYLWKVKVGANEVPIQVHPPDVPGLAPYWIPSNYLPSACGNSTGTLGIYVDGGASSDHVQVSVAYGPC